MVNISSVLGIFSYPGLGPYVATKSAVRGLTETLRQELDMEACGVSATSVHPGGIRTNIARAGAMRSEYQKAGKVNADSLSEVFTDDNETSGPPRSFFIFVKSREFVEDPRLDSNVDIRAESRRSINKSMVVRNWFADRYLEANIEIGQK